MTMMQMRFEMYMSFNVRTVDVHRYAVRLCRLSSAVCIIVLWALHHEVKLDYGAEPCGDTRVYVC